jgi:hypothetical protein
MSNIITPQNARNIFGRPWIPDNQVVYVRPLNTSAPRNNDSNAQLRKWCHDNTSTCLKISVEDMRAYRCNHMLIAGKILSDNPFKGQVFCFDNSVNTFMLKYFNKYFWVLVAAAKFKVLLRRIRIKKDKKNSKTFLLWTRTHYGSFGGMSNLPIRKNIVDFVA